MFQPDQGQVGTAADEGFFGIAGFYHEDAAPSR